MTHSNASILWYRGNLSAFEVGGAENFALRPPDPSAATGTPPKGNVFSFETVKTSITGTKDVVKEAFGVFKEHGILRRREYGGVAPQVHGAPKDYEVWIPQLSCVMLAACLFLLGWVSGIEHNRI